MKCLVIVRHLMPTCPPVVSRVITCAVYDNMAPEAFKAALQKEATLHIEKFKEQFIEFKSAVWYEYVIEIDEYIPYPFNL